MSERLSVDLEQMLFYKRRVLAKIYTNGDKDSIKKQYIE